MKTRIKSAVSTLTLTRDDVETLINDITLARINEIKATAAMDEALAIIRGPYDIQIAAYQDFIKTKTALVQQWAEANPSEFAKRKSIEFPTGKIGFRTGTPKLKLLARWTWAMVLDALVSCGLHKYIRVKEEVDKDALIRTATLPASDPDGADPDFATAVLKRVGLKLVQDETFYVEPNLTAVEHRETNQATERGIHSAGPTSSHRAA